MLLRDCIGRFIKGMVPHNKSKEIICIVDGCNREDMKAFGLCKKHYRKKLNRESSGIFNSDLSKRLPRTEEHIEKQRLQRIGKSTSLKGKTYKDIYGKNSNKYYELRRGKNNGCWKGGLSFEKYSSEFKTTLRKQIRERDNYTCRECGITEKQCKRNLDVHHIDFNKKNNLPENLISLCKRCHGNTQKDRNYWINYYKEKMEA